MCHICSSRWIRKEYYGDSNNLFEHDLGVAHSDAVPPLP